MTKRPPAPSVMPSAKLEVGRTFEDEAEHQLPIMRREAIARRRRRADDAHLGEAAGRARDRGLLRFAAVRTASTAFAPRCAAGSAARRTAASGSIRSFGSVRSWSAKVSCSAGQLISTTSRPGELSSTRWRISGRLQHQVAGVHHERLALVLVDDAHPAAPDGDELQRDAVEMHPVGDRPALGDRDVRGDVAPAEPARDQVAVEHAGPALAAPVAARA